MADAKISNDDKQLIELKLVNHIHAIALRKDFPDVEHVSIGVRFSS